MSKTIEPGWWITTDFFHRGGRTVLGPFIDQELALKVRTYVEKAEGHSRYFVDEKTTALAVNRAVSVDRHAST